MIELTAHNKNCDVLLPKSRTVSLGAGEIPGNMNLWDYNYYVYDCLMTSGMVRSLIYYASRFNWDNREPCFVSLQRMANDLKVGRKYLKQHLLDLEECGWVKVEGDRGDKNVFLVTPMIGYEVPAARWKEPKAKKQQLDRDNSSTSSYKRRRR